MPHHNRPFLILLVAAGLVLACGAQAQAPRGSAATSGEPAPGIGGPVPAEVLPAEIVDAIALRREFGLRSDEAWVRAVAANPDAVMDLGVPLLPFERDDILNRAGGHDAVVEAIQEYAAEHPDVFGGLYIDRAAGGIVTVMFTGDASIHEVALAELVGPGTFVVRQVRWSEAELRDLQDRLSADEAFFASLPARVSSVGVDIMENVAEINISSAVPDAAQRIAARFGAEGQLRVISDGTGILLQPTGRILGRILAPPGFDVTQLSPQYAADVDIGGRDSIGIGVAPDGTFVIDQLPPATYTVTILEINDAGNTEVGSTTVLLPPGAAVAVQIHVEP